MEEKRNKEFASRLKKLREEKGLSQRDLAAALNISKSTISMYESGEREPNFVMLESIADYFNVDINYLFGKTEIKNRYNFGHLYLPNLMQFQTPQVKSVDIQPFEDYGVSLLYKGIEESDFDELDKYVEIIVSRKKNQMEKQKKKDKFFKR